MDQQTPPDSSVQPSQEMPSVQLPQQQPTVISAVTPKTPFNKTLAVIMALFVLSLIVCGSYYAGMQSQKASDKLTNPYLKNIDATAIPTKIENTKNITHMSVSPTPTPDLAANWTLYSNAKYGYSVKYPTGLSPMENNSSYHFVAFGVAQSDALPALLTSVIPDTFTASDVAAYNYMSSDWINQFYAMKVGDSKTTASGSVFTELSSTTVAGQNAVVVGVVATGYKQHRVYVKKGGYIYMFSNYYQTDSELANFQLFLSSVKFN